MRSWSVAVLLVLAALACGYGPYRSLPERERARFDRCFASSVQFRGAVCAANDPGIGGQGLVGATSSTGNCEASGQHLYVDQRTEARRLAWLEESGCPARLARP